MPTNVFPRLTTADELFRTPADGYRYELIEGKLSMMSPAGGRHGRIAFRIARLLDIHVEQQQLGVVFAAETGFLLSSAPDTVLAPDVAYVERSRHESLNDPVAYIPLAPDLAIEVLSPSDRFSRVESKSFAWLDAGSKLVLLVDPETESIHAYRSRKQIEVFQRHETIDCSDAVPGWSVTIEQVFRLY